MVHGLWACATSYAQIRLWVWTYYVYACVVRAGAAVVVIRPALCASFLLLLPGVSKKVNPLPATENGVH